MISVVMPIYNEENVVQASIKELIEALKSFANEYEIIVVNDGSTDQSLARIQALRHPSITILDHAENLGYGKSLLDGIRAAKFECIAIIDGDGSYPCAQLKELYTYYPRFDMVVGARQGSEYLKGMFKRPARLLFKSLAKYATGREIPDVNSGLRIFKKSIVTRFEDMICTGFSFTTTITLLFMLNHYFVKYVPVEYRKRNGKSKVKHFRDTLRAGQIIIQTIVIYNPIKLFLLISTITAIAGIILATINAMMIRSLFLMLVAAFCVASFMPMFSFGLIIEALRKRKD